MLQEKKTDVRNKLSISFVQKKLFLLLLFLLPITIFPFPWDWTERGMSILILFFATTIIALELSKLIWDGSLSIIKSGLDFGLLLLLFTMLLSTIFSVDINVSIWGVDFRLGSSLLLFVAIFLLTLSSRSFIKKGKDIDMLILAFLTGIFINNVVSIFLFFDINIYQILPIYRDLLQTGVPLLRSSNIHILLNLFSVIMCIGLGGSYFIDKNDERRIILPILFIIISVFNIWIFSLNQGALFLVAFLLLSLMVILLFFSKAIKEKKTLKSLLTYALVIVLIAVLPAILLQIPSVRNQIVPSSMNTVSEVTLGAQISWVISASVLVSSIPRALFGMGLDTYSVSYYQYRPMDGTLLPFAETPFYYGANEVLTQLSNGGILYFLIWILIGYLVVKNFWLDIQSFSKEGEETAKWRLLIFNFALLFLFLSSFFVNYSVIVLFIFLSLVSFRAIAKALLQKGTEEKFLLKFWAVDMSVKADNKNPFSRAAVGMSLFVAICALSLLGVWSTKLLSSAYILRAESYLSQETLKYQDVENITIEQREVFLNSLISYYSRALRYEKNNPIANRRLALIYVEKLLLNAEKASLIEEGDEEQDPDAFTREIISLKNLSLDRSKRSLNTMPSVYANWDANSRIYLALVDVGFYDSYTDAMFALEKSISLNPSNFQLYYKRGQLFLFENDIEMAIEEFRNVLIINPKHIPSIIWMANLNLENGNTEVYESYLKAAKKILENEGMTDIDLYSEISKELRSLQEASGGEQTVEEGNEDQSIEIEGFEEGSLESNSPGDLGLESENSLLE